MKKIYAFLTISTLLCILTFSLFSSAGAQNSNSVKTKNLNQTTTVVVTILQIDLAKQFVKVETQKGKIFEFTVDPKYGIDLRKFKVGEKVRATMSKGTDSSNRELRTLLFLKAH